MRRNWLIVLGVLLLPLTAKSGSGVCITTLSPSGPFITPAPYDAVCLPNGMFWYGTEDLWTSLGSGVWHFTNNSDTSGGYFTKLVFWTKEFDWRKEPAPDLIVTAKRTDGDSPSVAVAHAHAVFVPGNTPAMMTGIRIPTAGCWEVISHYRSKALTFTVSVEP